MIPIISPAYSRDFHKKNLMFKTLVIPHVSNNSVRLVRSYIGMVVLIINYINKYPIEKC